MDLESDIDLLYSMHNSEDFDNGIPAGGTNQILLAEDRRTSWPAPSQEFDIHPVASIYKVVKRTGIPNEKGARILLHTRLNVSAWLLEHPILSNWSSKLPN